MAGSIDLTTAGIRGVFQTEKAAPAKPRPEATPASEQSTQPGRKEVEDVTAALNATPAVVDRNLSFSVDEASGRIVIKVTNAETGEVIRVIPPEDVARAQTNQDGLVGLLLNEER